MNQCSRDSGALLLTDTQVAWPAAGLVCNAELFQELEAFAFVERRSAEERGHGEVFQHREALEEVRFLKNDADVLAAKSVALRLGHLMQRPAVDIHRALGRLQHATEQMQ